MLRLKLFMLALCAGNACAMFAMPGRPRGGTPVDSVVARVAQQLTVPDLRRAFVQCYPNTLETTVSYTALADGDDDTFVITGDIPAMWQRDAAAQVWPYLPLAASDSTLRHLLRGVVRRQLRNVLIDPYANAFCRDADSLSPSWADDYTVMRRGVFERKYELDALCYPLRLADGYRRATGDMTIFDGLWQRALRSIVATMRQQQQPVRPGVTPPYRFARRTHAMHDTRSNYGVGHPARVCGMIASAFRPSDDCCLFPYNIPQNLMARDCLLRAIDIERLTENDTALVDDMASLVQDITDGVQRYGRVDHPRYGTIYAYEVDAYGSVLLMDDANIPSLLSLPYIAGIDKEDSVYQHTRRFVLSADNPYYFSGIAGRGIGGPHVGLGYIWPMSLIMQVMTATDEAEIKECLCMLLATDADTGYMHEAFYQDDATRYTRPWFAWCNSLFGEMVLQLIADGRLSLLNAVNAPFHGNAKK
jgi:hypothetical protein